MKYSLFCMCGYETPLTEDEDELTDDGRIGEDLLIHRRWCPIDQLTAGNVGHQNAGKQKE